MDINVSIVVPVYNVEPYLEKCLVSLVNQDMEGFEIVLVDDGSTDNSLAICKDFKDKYDFIEVYSQDNRGQANARNRGMSLARGKYIAFVDSDDYVAQNYCSKMFSAIEKHNADVVICNHIAVYSKGEEEVRVKSSKSDFRKVYEGSVLSSAEILMVYAMDMLLHSPCNKMYRMSIFTDGTVKFPDGVYFEDPTFAIQIFKDCSRFFIVPDTLYYYNQRINSTTYGIAYYSAKRTRDYYTQFSRAIEYFHEAGAGIIDNRYIKKYIKDNTDKMVNLYLEYQYDMFCLLLLAEQMEDTCCFFGASSSAEKYICNMRQKRSNVFFVDNDSNKQGSKYYGYDIFSPETLKERKSQKIFITSMYFFEIVEQLMRMGIINDITSIMPFAGKTEIERAFADGFSHLLTALKKVGDIQIN